MTKTMTKYFGGFAEEGWASVQFNFSIEMPEPDVLFACYDVDGYEGEGLVIYKQDDKLYRVQGSHCSCYGLEHSWEPEETTAEAIEHELRNGYHYGLVAQYKLDIYDAIKGK